MAWRPTEYLIEGVLDNTVPHKVTGYMKFAGLDKPVIFNLDGNFHRDIRGAKIQFANDTDTAPKEARGYMEGLSLEQTGSAGDITKGEGDGADYVNYGYIEWYSNENGRVVIELDSEQIELLTKPIPVCESDPIDRNEQHNNMMGFMNDIVDGISKNPDN